ncbi:hypothetical protein FBULB1_12699 [Fusarium bulbicola]|nr:hypothetical protein FBULB1_12699 [Fusarium bulbicola]
MPGLEPLAALGLVCNVLQLVEVGLKTATLCKDAYRTGEPDPDLGIYAQNLAATASSLTRSLEVSQQPLNIEDARLLTLARNCRDAEAEWRKKTPARFLSQQQPRKRDRFGAIFRGIINKPEIDRLERQLQKAKESLETDLLVGIFKSLDVSKVQANDLQDKFLDLLQATSTSEKKLHDLIQAQVTLVNTQISDRIDQAEASAKTHVTAELASHESRLKSHADQGKDTILTEAEMRENIPRENDAYERLLRSFQYPDMNLRRTEIHSSHASTFHWIFEGGNLDIPRPNSPRFDASDSDAEDLVCGSFVKWLKSTEDRYWISGKPGTGKSVLMKFIISHKQMIASLRQWQPKAQILTHFFWKFGSPMQSSFKGFLCSLVYQVLTLDKSHAICCLQQNPDWPRRTGLGDWDSEDLQSFITTYLSLPSQPFCLFVDGVDELLEDDGVGILVGFLDILQQSSPLLKIYLKMQDLTRADIEQYSRATLTKEISPTIPSIDVEAIVSHISQKAEGVFLWAVLVTKSIARGIVNGDSNDDIQKRLHKTPKKLHKLYLDMWTRLGEDSDIYQSSTALIFKIILFIRQSFPKNVFKVVPQVLAYPISILELMLASSGHLWSTPVDQFVELSTTDLEQRCHELSTSLPFRTADLFEVFQTRRHERPYETQWADPPKSQSMVVEAIHRTVFDFLIETEDGKKIMEHHKATEEELFVRIFRSCLLRDCLWPEIDFCKWPFDWKKENSKEDRSWPHEASKVVYVRISMSILVQVFLQRVVEDDATFKRREFEEALDLETFSQIIRPVMLGLGGGYFLAPSSMNLPVFQSSCKAREATQA